MTVIKSSNKKDFLNKYNWKFVMRFRLNKQGVVDDHYQELLEECQFWCEYRAKGEWERQNNVYYFKDMNDMLMFNILFSEQIRTIYEDDDWSKKLLTSTPFSKNEIIPAPSNVIEVNTVKDIEELNA